MPRRAASVRSDAPVEQLIADMTIDELREVVSAAVDRHVGNARDRADQRLAGFPAV